MNTILLITDNVDDITAVESVITNELTECALIKSLSGQEGIEITHTKKPDVAIIGSLSKGMKSIDVCSKLKTHFFSKFIPLLFIGSNADASERKKAYNARYDSYLVTPVNPIELSVQITLLLRLKLAQDKKWSENTILEELILIRTDKLKENERRLNTLFNNLPGIAYRCKNDANWTMEFVSGGFESITGYPSEDIIGNKKLSFNDLIVSEDRARVWEEVQSAIETKKRFELNYKIRKASGEIRNVLEKGVGIFSDGDDRLIALEGFITDITGQVAANKALHDSEELNKSIAQTAADAIISINADGNILSWNLAAERMFGYTSSEMMDKTLSEIIPEQHKSGHSLGIQRLKKGGKEKILGSTIQITALRKSGVGFPIELSLSGWERNNQRHYTGIIRDISDRKKAEMTLQESEGKYRKLIETTSEGFWMINPQKRTVDVNKALCEMLGYSRDEMLEKDPLDFIDDENKKSFINLISRSSNKQSGNFEIGLKRENGNLVPVLFHVTSISDQDNNFSGSFIFISDITERKHAQQIQKVLYHISNAVNTTDNVEQLIALIQDELSTIIDTTNFYIALYYEKTNTFSLPFHSDQKDKITVFPAGKTLTAYVVKSKKPLLATRKVKKQLEEAGEVELVGADSKVWLGVPLKLEGKTTGVLAVQSYKDEKAYDESDMNMLGIISEQISLSIHRKKAEQELKAALKKAEESDRLKSAFLATMTHELRTPLNSIIGFSDLITADMAMEDVLDLNQTINESGTQLLKIVEDILAYTQIDAGETKIMKEEIDLPSLLYEVNSRILAEREKAGKESIEINEAFPVPDKGLIIYTDASKLKQILIYLLKNALKFTNNGQIDYGYSIETKNEKPMLRFFVKDTGIGIPRDKHELIFEVFRQLDDSRNRSYEGTGIGLSIARKLIALLGGEIWLESEVGKGSTFYFTISYQPDELEENINGLNP